jgi:LysM repeat protein
MSLCRRLAAGAVAAVLLIAANGCSPPESSDQDEEKEPHFVLGNSRFNTYDYDGAIEAFEQALEVNPHSAQAHYRLAQIFDTKKCARAPDPAAAIYHYNEYLRLDARAENSELVRQRVLTCKQQLAQDVMSIPTSPQTMRQIERLTETNRLFQAQIEQMNDTNRMLEGEISRLNDVVHQWSVYAAGLQMSARNNSTPATMATPGTSTTPDDTTMATTTSQTPTPTSTTHPARGRTHVVSSGETLAGIARKSGVSLSALEAANPGVTPKKLRVGQTLNLP